MRRLVVLSIAAAALLLAAPAGAAPRAYTYEPIAYLGGPAPGGGTLAGYLAPQAINASGEVAFEAGVSDGSDGVFTGTPTGLDVVARTGYPAPGGPFVGVSWGKAGLNNAGESAFAFADPDTSIGSVYRTNARTGRTDLVASVGEALPGGGTFVAVPGTSTAINVHGDVALDALVSGGDLDPGSPPGVDGTSLAVYLAPHGTHDLVDVARPGDPAPGGGVFDQAGNPSINGSGDVAFEGHVPGDPCQLIRGEPFCLDAVFLWHRASQTLVSVARSGDASPCAGRSLTWAVSALVNASGDVAFIGDFGSDTFTAPRGVFVWHDGRTRAVACPGQAMPGGGTLLSGPTFPAQHGINQRGWVSYAASLDEDTDGNGTHDSGIYVERHGQTSLVVRTGTALPGIGTVVDIGEPFAEPVPAVAPGDSGGLINRNGQVVLVVRFTDGREAIVRATPVRA